jgi:hypothetical protein
LFYGGAGVSARHRSQADARFQTEGTGHLGVNFVGDIDGDTFNDLAIFDTNSGTTSRLTLWH